MNTPRLIADGTGTTVWRWDQQEPFGNDVPNGDPNSTGAAFEFPLRFPGQYADRETNLYYNVSVPGTRVDSLTLMAYGAIRD